MNLGIGGEMTNMNKRLATESVLVTPLQSKVAFGTMVRWDTTSMIMAVAGFILLAAAYYGLRSGMQRWTQRS